MSGDQNEPLRRPTFEPLPLGDVLPAGWLRQQLRIQADGLTGHLDEFWPDLADNQWVGGERGGWERGPYYADGLLPLAYLLDDDELKAKARKWVEGFLDHQRSDGWIGPVAQASHQGYERDPWPRFVVLKVLRQYYEVTGEDDVLDSMLEFCRSLDEQLAERPLESWAKYRWQDLVVSVYWLFERTDEDRLLELAETAIDQGYDWRDHYRSRNRFEYADPASEWSQDSHVVNHAMSIKAPGLLYRLSGAPEDRDVAHRAIDVLDRFHGQASGMFSGDECLAGPNPTRGTELCSVVEFMYSLAHLVAVFGETRFADRLERVAYNALPATFTPDMWAHQYDQQVNQVVCNVAPREWTNGPDANVFGLEPNFGCCTANMHQGWPKFAKHLWMDAGDGVAAIAYAPCEVETEIDGVPVTISEETDYPFDDDVHLAVDPAEATTFTLYLRVPGWAEDATIALPDGTVHRPEAGGFHEISRHWSPTDEVAIRLSSSVTVERRYQGAISVRRGPLLFANPIEADWKQIGGERPRADWELYPAEPWNYGLRVDPDGVDEAITRRVRAPDHRPFAPENPPVVLDAPGVPISDWTLSGNDAGPIPRSPDRVTVESRTLRLIPYGCTNLRVAEFPLVSPDT